MPQGLQTWNGSNKLLFDTNMMTGRIIGNVSVSAPHLQKLTVTLSPGKKLWWFIVPEGAIEAYAYRVTYSTNPSLIQGPNQFTIQTEVDWKQPSKPVGTAHVFWGEC